MSVRVNLRGMLRLIRVDTLSRVHNVGFLVTRLMSYFVLFVYRWYYQSTQINDGLTGGPLAIFDRDGRTIVLSPFNNFMSASFLHDQPYGGNFYGGIMGGAFSISGLVNP